MNLQRVDAHQHFWRYSPAAYAWISESMGVLQRDFLPADLLPLLQASGIDGSIAVQAQQSLRETEWLLELAEAHNFIQAVVGWVPLISDRVSDDLEKLAGNHKFKSVRHVLQDEADDFYMLRQDFNRGLSTLDRLNLAYDILIFERHLPQTIEFVDRHPNQRFILDHIAKPRIKEGALSPWQENIRELARRDNVFCKLSGMVTEADLKTWNIDSLRPYVDTVLEAFRPRRLMFGSDWPVARLACDYRRWVESVQSLISQLSPDEQSQIFGGTAQRAYRL
jgi:L-fuconolactonase